MSEVKDADMGHHESWCDCKNSISNYCNCLASGYIEQIHDLKAKYEKCLSALKTYHFESCDSFDNKRICSACKTLGELGEK